MTEPVTPPAVVTPTAVVNPPGAPAVDRHPLTVAELLALPILERGRPQVLAGDDLDRREVRWVHTSEIYEISPLLKGGEVLLTTGLGLVGASDEQLRDYAVDLATRPIAALVLEVGRTFTRAPDVLVRAARDCGLPLVTMSGIVPFVEITEYVHARLISTEVERLRLTGHIETTLTATMLAGLGLTGILRELAALAGCAVQLVADDGHLVASSASGGSGPGHDGDQGSTDPTMPSATVAIGSTPWGRLVVCGAPTDSRRLIADRGATAVALELTRSGSSLGPSRRRAAAVLLRDIFGRQYSSVDDIAGRAAALGLTIRTRGFVVGICLATDDGTPASARSETAVADAAGRVLGPVLATELDGSHLLAACVDTDETRDLMGELADAIDAELPAGRAVAVTCGPPVRDFGALARSLRVAREASVLARRLHSDMRTLLWTDMGVHRLLSRFTTDPELATFVEEQLGPLLDYDATHGRELVRTLDALLACGLSKTAAARRLRVRRQTLYQRLETISALLGGLDLAARERRTSLDLALVGWRLRAAGIPDAHGSPGGPASRPPS